MLAYNFDYYLPDTMKEATDIYSSLQKEGKNPYYYGGGTEIISMVRVHDIRPDAVIDIKKIPDCCVMGTEGDELFFGSALTLKDIYESGLFPLLGLSGSRVADHTIQVKITLGGNLAGTIFYHETLLPLILSDSTIYTASPEGNREVPISDVLAMNKGLKKGELIVKVSLDKKYTMCPYSHIKKSKSEKIGYPLISVAAINLDGMMRMATSGLCSYPFRSNDTDIENNLSDKDIAKQLARNIPAPILDDISGSEKYREFVFKKTIENTIKRFRQNGGC